MSKLFKLLFTAGIIFLILSTGACGSATKEEAPEEEPVAETAPAEEEIQPEPEPETEPEYEIVEEEQKSEEEIEAENAEQERQQLRELIDEAHKRYQTEKTNEILSRYPQDDLMKEASESLDRAENKLSEDDFSGARKEVEKAHQKIQDALDRSSEEDDRYISVVEALKKIRGDIEEESKEEPVSEYGKKEITEAVQQIEEGLNAAENREYSKAEESAEKAGDLLKKAKDNAPRRKESVEYYLEVKDKYQSALQDNVVRDYGLNEIRPAKRLLEEADELIKDNQFDEADEKTSEADKIIDIAVKTAGNKYEEYLEEKKRQEEAERLRLEAEKEKLKKQAEELLREMEEKMRKLKEKKGETSFYIEPEHHEMIFLGTLYTNERFGRVVSVSEPETNITVEGAEEYADAAYQAFENEEYLETIDHAREAIRMIEALLAMEENEIYEVQLNPDDRDCLWKIAGKMYHKKTWLWPVIWRANKYQISDPDLIYPGQEFKIPPVAE